MDENKEELRKGVFNKTKKRWGPTSPTDVDMDENKEELRKGVFNKTKKRWGPTSPTDVDMDENKEELRKGVFNKTKKDGDPHPQRTWTWTRTMRSYEKVCSIRQKKMRTHIPSGRGHGREQGGVTKRCVQQDKKKMVTHIPNGRGHGREQGGVTKRWVQ